MDFRQETRQMERIITKRRILFIRIKFKISHKYTCNLSKKEYAAMKYTWHILFVKSLVLSSLFYYFVDKTYQGQKKSCRDRKLPIGEWANSNNIRQLCQGNCRIKIVRGLSGLAGVEAAYVCGRFPALRGAGNLSGCHTLP